MHLLCSLRTLYHEAESTVLTFHSLLLAFSVVLIPVAEIAVVLEASQGLRSVLWVQLLVLLWVGEGELAAAALAVVFWLGILKVERV